MMQWQRFIVKHQNMQRRTQCRQEIEYFKVILFIYLAYISSLTYSVALLVVERKCAEYYN